MMISIILTTINVPQNLDNILLQIGKNDSVIIVTDRKTPYFQIDDKRVKILDIKEQIDLCKNPIGIPFDCIQRRNFGYIYAIKYLKPDAIITIDDDNFVSSGWFEEHINNIGSNLNCIIEKKTNIIDNALTFSCDLHDDCRNVVHRGITFSQVCDFSRSAAITKKIVKVAVNAGLWIGDPDINAYDRVLHPNIKSEMKSNESFVLNNSWYYPFNSQNTVIDKFLFPALFLIPMFKQIYGKKIGRYDDIWQSYICEKIMSKNNLFVRFGSPIVRQDRNEHNLKRDLNEEFVGLAHNEKFLEKLDNIKLLCSSPLENMYEISENFMLSEDELMIYVGEKILWWLSEIK